MMLPARRLERQVHADGERGLDHAGERAEHAVADRGEDRPVKARVGTDETPPVVAGRIHLVEGSRHGAEMVRRGAQRRQRRHRRLESAAELEDLAHELDPRHRRPLPGEHVRIEQVPAFRRAHPRPGLRPRLEQPLAGEDLGRLAHDRAADAELGAQVGFVGERRAGHELAGDDAHADGVDHAAKQPAAGDRGAEQGLGFVKRQPGAWRALIHRCDVHLLAESMPHPICLS